MTDRISINDLRQWATDQADISEACAHSASSPRRKDFYQRDADAYRSVHALLLIAQAAHTVVRVNPNTMRANTMRALLDIAQAAHNIVTDLDQFDTVGQADLRPLRQALDRIDFT